MTTVAQWTVRYFAVYPDGRRCPVTCEDAAKLHAEWKAFYGVDVETEIEAKLMPVVGKLVGP